MTQSKRSQRVQRETRNHSACQSECHRANALNNVIVSSSLNTKGTVKIHHPSFARLEGTNDPHHYILTEYRRNNEVTIAHLLPTWRAPTMVHHIVTSSLNTEGTTKIHRPSSASLEGTNDVSRSCKHQHSLSTRETSSTILSIF